MKVEKIENAIILAAGRGSRNGKDNEKITTL